MNEKQLVLDELQIRNSGRASFIPGVSRAPLFVQGDIATNGTIHTKSGLVIHEKSFLENEIHYPGTIGFWNGHFYGYNGVEWNNWSEITEDMHNSWKEWKQKQEETQIWKAYEGNSVFIGSSLAIGKPFVTGSSFLEIGGDVSMDRALQVKGIIRAENGIRIMETEHKSEYPGMIRFQQGEFSGYTGKEWISFHSPQLIQKEKPILFQKQESNELYATREYVDRMVSIGMTWFPMIHWLIQVSIHQVPKMDEEWIWSTDLPIKYEQHIWFMTEQKTHLGMFSVVRIENQMIYLRRMIQDPQYWDGIYMGSLNGVIVEQVQWKEELKSQEFWWIRYESQPEKGQRILECGTFTIPLPKYEIIQPIPIQTREVSCMIGIETKEAITECLQIEEPKIQEGMIQGQHIQAQAIVSHHLFPNLIHSEHISMGEIHSEHLAKECFQSQYLANNTIESRHLGKEIITSRNIASNCIREHHIAQEGWDFRRIFQKRCIQSDWIALNGLEGSVIQPQAISGHHLVRGCIETHHLSNKFHILESHLSDHSIQTKHIQSLSGDILEPGTGRSDFFGNQTIPGTALQLHSIDGLCIKEQTIQKNHLQTNLRGFDISWNGGPEHVWAAETTNRVELGGQMEVHWNPFCSTWERLPVAAPRNWTILRRAQSDIELGDRKPLEQMLWDQTGYRKNWENPEQWSKIELYGNILSRGCFTHRGPFRIEGDIHFHGKVDMDELTYMKETIQEVWNHSLYQACPIGSIVGWELNREIPKGWKVYSAIPKTEHIQWIQRSLTEEVQPIISTIIQESNNQ